MNSLYYYLQRKTTNGNVPETSTSTVSFTDPGQTEMDEGANISHDVRACVKKKQQSECNRGGK